MDRNKILEKSVAFSVDVIRFCKVLERSREADILGRQLIRSATSIGANVHEAQAAQSKADFIAKISIAHKEARETSYWLRLIHEAGLAAHDSIREIIDENDQMIKILSSILLTSKQNHPNK